MEEVKLSDSFIVGIGIQRSILNKFGDATALGADWDLNEFINSIKDQKEFKEFDIYKLSDAELLGLGFGKISDKCNIRLIPTWIYPFLPDQVCVYGKDKPEPVVIPKTQLGKPVVGYFGLGILAAGTPITNEEVQAITPDQIDSNQSEN